MASFLMRIFRQVLGTPIGVSMIIMGRGALFPHALHSRQTSFLIFGANRLVGSHCDKPLLEAFSFSPYSIRSDCSRCHFHTRSQFYSGKSLRIKWPLSQPHHPHRFQNLALGIESRVPHTSRAKAALLVKSLDRVWPSGRFARRSPGVIGKIFELMISAPIQPLVA